MDCLVSETCGKKLKAEKCRQHAGKKLFCCEGCDKEIVSNLKLQKHILTNSVGKPFICDVCAEAFGQKIELVMHMVKHNGAKLLGAERTIADGEARGDNLVESRLISVKNELHESFPCDVCQQEITQEDGSVTHICTPVLNKTSLSNNANVKMFGDLYQNLSAPIKTEIRRCDLCEYVSANETKFSQHVRKHNAEKTDVGVGYPRQDSSSDNVTESCDICGREFTSKSSLFRHIRTHTGEKPFTCGVCQKEFAQRGTLRRHLQIHTGHKPFRCKVCTREFTQSCTLVRHMRTHTGEKPYRCNVCDKRFSQNGALLQHIRLHTGERPYKCSICRRSFSTNKHLLSHVSSHTKEEACCQDDKN